MHDLADPTPIFEHYRGSYGTDLLVAAVSHLGVFDKLARLGPCTFDELAGAVGLARRPAVVLFTALRAMKLIIADDAGRLALAPVAAQHLVSAAPLSVADYLGLSAQSPGVLSMVHRLRTNRPPGAHDSGAAFIYRDGIASAMDSSESARHLTLALAGRARNVAPHLAAAAPITGPATLLDVGGGTGLYAIAYLRANPQLRAIVFDRPEVLKIAAEFAAEARVTDRLQLAAGDMFADPLPAADAVLLSNILHDWDEPECDRLVGRCAGALNPGGQLLIHDVLLHDAHDGPLPIALYSAALFSITEGRAYSAAEYRAMLRRAGLQPSAPVPTHIHCHAIRGRKESSEKPETEGVHG